MRLGHAIRLGAVAASASSQQPKLIAWVAMPRASLLRAWTRRRGGASSGYWLAPWRWRRPRSRRRCGSWSTTLNRRLNGNRHRRSCFEEVDRGVCSLRRLIRIKPEIIQSAPANRVGILVLRKGLAAPRQRVGGLGRCPRRAAKSGISLGPIMSKSGMLRRRMKPDVTNADSASQGHTERLNRAIQIHIIESILIVPDSSRWVGYFVADKPEAVVPRIRVQAVHCRASPRPDGRLHSGSFTCWRKAEVGCATH